MNLPPPPPLPPSPSNSQSSILPSPNKCYEKPKALQYGEALLQVERAMASESESDQFMTAFVVPLLQPLLQCGPVCGIIALVEAMQLLGTTLDPDNLLQDAIRLKMTKSGEMFSASEMQRLADTCGDYQIKLMNTTDVSETWEVLFQHLTQGNPALIPYDADFDHRPALRRGHAAHWAVLHGLVIPNSQSLSNKHEIINVDSQPYDFTKLFDCSASEQEKKDLMINACVIAHHGKSARTALWKFVDLINSNQNLVQVSPKITANQEVHLFDSIQTDLCSKLLLLKRTDKNDKT